MTSKRRRGLDLGQTVKVRCFSSKSGGVQFLRRKESKWKYLEVPCSDDEETILFRDPVNSSDGSDDDICYDYEPIHESADDGDVEDVEDVEDAEDDEMPKIPPVIYRESVGDIVAEERLQEEAPAVPAEEEEEEEQIFVQYDSEDETLAGRFFRGQDMSALTNFENKYLDAINRHVFSHAGAEEIWHIFKEEFNLVGLHSYRMMRRRASQILPTVRFEYAYVDKNGHTKVVEEALNLSDKEGKRLYEIGFIPLLELKSFHQQMHSAQVNAKLRMTAVVSNDGVQETKSTSRSLNVFSIRFTGCKQVYPIAVIRGNDPAVDSKGVLRKIIDECRACHISIKCVVADAPKRAELREVKSHTSYYACDICMGKAERSTRPGGHSKKIAWPSTELFPIRTHDWTRHIADNLQTIHGDNKRYGIKGKSVLFEIPGFDVIKDMAPEYMHFAGLGVVRLLVQVTFKVANHRPTKCVQKKIPVSLINDRLMSIRVPGDFSRKVRPLDPACWKAEEYRNLIIFYWPAVLSSIPEDQDKSKQLWLHLAFLFRAYTLPELEFQHLSKRYLRRIQKITVDKMRRLHGAWNCTYNVHQLLHLDILREKGPLYKTSAFPFEGMFAKVRSGFVPGTPNPIKQIMNSIYQRMTSGHACRNSINLHPNQTRTVDDSLFYTYSEEEYRFYQILETPGINETVKCLRIQAFEGQDVPPGRGNKKNPELPWGNVGVYLLECMDDSEELQVPRADIAGKAIRVENYIMSVPNGVLRETK